MLFFEKTGCSSSNGKNKLFFLFFFLFIRQKANKCA